MRAVVIFISVVVMVGIIPDVTYSLEWKRDNGWCRTILRVLEGVGTVQVRLVPGDSESHIWFSHIWGTFVRNPTIHVTVIQKGLCTRECSKVPGIPELPFYGRNPGRR